MKLISMTDFVLQFDKPAGYFEDQSDYLNCQVDYMNKVMLYAQFLKQLLRLGFFLPCDENGNVLTEPNPTDWTNLTPDGKYRDIKYQEAKERVLFKAFDKKGGMSVARAICASYLTIEDLTYKKVPLVDLELTDSGIKQIGLQPL